MCALASGARADGTAHHEFFRRQVEPILVKRCLECHGRERKGGLDLRRRETALAGGDDGPVIRPGRPGDSLLVEYVTSGDMPPGTELPEDEVAVLEEWVRTGAWFPSRELTPYAFTTEQRAGYDWWSLQPVERPIPPEVRDVPRVRNEIDRFVLARLESEGLSLAPPADRATWIRRVSYDLTGLSPSPGDVRRFVADTRPNAYERLVDRLLASPHYGERWARHWLDVVRFAESNGFERDRIRLNFWRYRDYVIRAFNEDKPYDRFVVEQLAGDALLPDEAEGRIATGFLAAGPKNDVATISPLERMRTRQDELDEFVVATSTTFLGLTVGCARCHDHKFDPIPTSDYYALTAVFSGCRHDKDAVIASPGRQERRARRLRDLRGEIEARKRRQREILRTARRGLAAATDESKPKDGAPAKLPAVSPRRNEDTFPPVKARFVRMTIRRTNGGQPCLDELEVFGPGDDANLALASSGGRAAASSLLPGFEMHKTRHLNDGRYGNDHSWISHDPQGWAQIELPGPAEVHRVVWGRDRQGRFADRVPLKYRIEVSLDGASWTRVSDSSRRAPPAGPLLEQEPPTDELLESLPPAQRESYDELEREVQALEEEIAGLPPLPSTYSIRDSGGRDEVPVLERGNVRSHGEMVPARALTAVRGLDRDLSADSGPERRLKLARWIAHPDNPLTARVLVNRIWHYHFGRGIVDTPSDFGFQGGRPSHPELLDYLAAGFVEHGWSIQRLQRQIVLSAVYRQSSAYREEAARQDADNRLLWRYAPRRLEAEAIRDTILQVSGTLDRTLGGPSFALFEYRDGNVPDYRLVESAGPETWRRTVYRYNIRTFHAPLMAAFDCPDPSVSTPRRSQTTNPLQALSLLNNPFVVRQAGFLAERIRRAAGDDPPAQIDAAYELVLLREPAEAERDRARTFVAEHGLAGLCRVLLNTNEFLYVF